MNICFLLHFYQPSNQLPEVTKQIAQECYVPLIKVLKSDKHIKLTANLPLALLAQLDTYGFDFLLRDIKELIVSQRLEIVGSGAYHPLLTKLPLGFAERQIILNELAQGYYFGADKDFEGEACRMVKDLRGFFPPEMAVNEHVIDVLESLGYDWVAVDDYCLPKDVLSDHVVGKSYRVGGRSIKLIVRDKALSNAVAFKRDQEKLPILDIMLQNDGDKLIALDGEAFGHHYKDGIYFFESLIAEMHKKGLQMSTVSQGFSGSDTRAINHVEESTWSSSGTAKYPLWESTHEVNVALWQLYNDIHREVIANYKDSFFTLSYGSGTVPLWKNNILQLEQSDQFWWSSGITVANKAAFSVGMVSSVLHYYRDVVLEQELSSELLTQIDGISGMLKDSGESD